ncbi:MAG TPA: G1 family glutamic endopeptidase [Candidatus Limnocylindria bacterium]|nr:G1 family glutamic endopeptidase [Candidatus Limnocylindria bacterium]
MRALAVLLALLLAVPSAVPHARPIVVAAANQSFNWSGYVQGSLEKGTTFHSVGADWVVPRAKQRVQGEAEYSSSWIGIGGGCLDTSCILVDATLIQAGIGHDVDASGDPDYYAWWETIPAPLIRTDLAVRPGDRVRVEIVESPATPGVWTITITDRDTGGVFTITLAYTSTYGTAEWVIETPVVISDDGAITVGPMPDLSVVHFDNATANGLPAVFVPAERIELVDFDLSLIAAPSLPDRDADGFNDCAYRRTCPAPGNELR